MARVGDYTSATGRLPAGSVPVATSVSGGTLYRTPEGTIIDVAVSSQGSPGGRGIGGGSNTPSNVYSTSDRVENIPKVKVEDLKDIKNIPASFEAPVLNESARKFFVQNPNLNPNDLLRIKANVSDLQRKSELLKAQARDYSEKAKELDTEGKAIQRDVEAFNNELKSKAGLGYNQQDLQQAESLQSRIASYNSKAQVLDLKRSELSSSQTKLEQAVSTIQNTAVATSKTGGTIYKTPSGQIFEEPSRIIPVSKKNSSESLSQPSASNLIVQRRLNEQPKNNITGLTSGKPIFQNQPSLITKTTIQEKPRVFVDFFGDTRKASQAIESGIVIAGEGIGSTGTFIGENITGFGRAFNQTFPSFVPSIFKPEFVKGVKSSTQVAGDFLRQGGTNQQFKQKIVTSAGIEFQQATFLLPGGIGLARKAQAAFLEKEPIKIAENLALAGLFAGGTIVATGVVGKATNVGIGFVKNPDAANFFIQTGKAVTPLIPNVFKGVEIGYTALNAIQAGNLTKDQRESQLAQQGAFSLGFELIGSAPKYLKKYGFYEPVPTKESFEVLKEYQESSFGSTPSVENIVENAKKYIVYEEPSVFRAEVIEQGGDPLTTQGGYQFFENTGESRIIFPRESDVDIEKLNEYFGSSKEEAKRFFNAGEAPKELIIHEFGHKLIQENPLYPEIKLKQAEVFRDFHILGLKSNQPRLLLKEIGDVTFYPKEDRLGEYLVRFASNYPEELINPTTETGKVLSQVYAPKLGKEFDLQSFVTGKNVAIGAIAGIGGVGIASSSFFNQKKIEEKPKDSFFNVSALPTSERINVTPSLLFNQTGQKGLIEPTKSTNSEETFSSSFESVFDVTPSGGISQVSGQKDDLSKSFIQSNLNIFENPRGTTQVSITSKPGSKTSSTITENLPGGKTQTRTDYTITDPSYDYDFKITERKFYGVGDPFFRATYQEALGEADVTGQLIGGGAANLYLGAAIGLTNINPFYPKQTKEALINFFTNEDNVGGRKVSQSEIISEAPISGEFLKYKYETPKELKNLEIKGFTNFQTELRSTLGGAGSSVLQFETAFSFPTASTAASKFQQTFPTGVTTPSRIISSSEIIGQKEQPTVFFQSKQETPLELRGLQTKKTITAENVFLGTKTAVEFTLPKILQAPFTLKRDVSQFIGKQTIPAVYRTGEKGATELIIDPNVYLGQDTFTTTTKTPQQLLTEFKQSQPYQDVTLKFLGDYPTENVRPYITSYYNPLDDFSTLAAQEQREFLSLSGRLNVRSYVPGANDLLQKRYYTFQEIEELNKQGLPKLFSSKFSQVSSSFKFDTKDPLYLISHATPSQLPSTSFVLPGSSDIEGLFGSPSNRLSTYFLERSEKISVFPRFSFGQPSESLIRVEDIRRIPGEYLSSYDTAKYFIENIAPEEYRNIAFISPNVEFARKTEAEAILATSSKLKQLEPQGFVNRFFGNYELISKTSGGTRFSIVPYETVPYEKVPGLADYGKEFIDEAGRVLYPKVNPKSIFFDLDNTLTNTSGNVAVKDIGQTLDKLKSEGYSLNVFIHSPEKRATAILESNDLLKYFDKVITREDYARGLSQNTFKDIRAFGGNIIVENNPIQIQLAKKAGINAVQTVNFHRQLAGDVSIAENIYKGIKSFESPAISSVKKIPTVSSSFSKALSGFLKPESKTITVAQLVKQSNYSQAAFGTSSSTYSQAINVLGLSVLNRQKLDLSGKSKPGNLSYSTFNFDKIGFLPSYTLPERGSEGGNVPEEPPIIPPYYPPEEGSKQGGSSGGGDSGGGDSGGGDSGGGSGGGSSGGSSGGGRSSSFFSGGSSFGGGARGSSPFLNRFNLEYFPSTTRRMKTTVQAFDVFIKEDKRRNARYIKANPAPLSYNQAFNLGEEIVDYYINQSFKLKKTKKYINQPINDAPIRNFFKYRKKGNTFIERRKFAIDMFGEVNRLKWEKRAKKGSVIARFKVKPFVFK